MSLPPHAVAKKAKDWYDKNDHPGLFEELLVRCTAWGVVIKTPDTFFLAEPAWSDGKSVWYDGTEEPNIWWCHVLVGKLDMPYFMSVAKPTKYIGWERNNDRVKKKYRIYKWERGIRDEFK